MSATPSRRRSALSQSHPQSAQSRRRSTAHNAVSEATPLPPYEPPEAPLTVESQRQIAALLSSQHFRTLQTHLQHAAEKLTHSGGEVNERLSDARGRYEKAKEVRRRQGDETVDDDESNEEYQRLAEAEARVDAVTARMEEKTRLIVDSEMKLQGLTEAMSQIEREEGEALSAALGARQTRQQRAMQRADAGDSDEDPNDENYEDPSEREARERNAQNPPSRKLVDKLTEGAQKWNELPLTERYEICLFSVVITGVLHFTEIDSYDLDMPAITPTSASTGWCTTPNSPVTTYPRSRIRQHGSTTWKTQTRDPEDQNARAPKTVAPRPLILTTLPFSASASLSNVH